MCSWAGLGVMQAQQRRVLRTELWITVSCYITCLVSVFSHFITHSLQILGAVTSEHSDMCSTCVITKARISQSEASTTSFWPIRVQQIDNTNSFQQYTCRLTDGERGREEVRIVICGPYHQRDHNTLPVLRCITLPTINTQRNSSDCDCVKP